MTDSPEELILDSDIIKTCQLMDKVQIIPQVEINSPVPDQENNIKDLKRLVENNNDETTENYEEFHHGIKCQKDDVVRKVQKSPAKNVTIQENAIVATTAHEIIRETKHHVGDTVLTTRPFAFVINASHRSIVCEYCWSTMVGGGLTWCQECGLVRYCGEVCRMKGWEEHRMECSFIGQEGAGGRVLNDQLRLVARIWLNLKIGRGQDGEQCGEYRMTWGQLEDHKEEIMKEKEELITSQYNLLGAVMKKEDMPDKETFISIYGKMLVNSLSLRSDRSFSPEPFGTGLYLLGAMFDHSCEPNCSIWFSGREIDVIATKDIPIGNITKNAFISYVNIMDDTQTRNENLQSDWYFTCKCRLCTDSKLEVMKRCIRCSRCGEDRAVDVFEWDLPPPCKSCKRSSVVEDQMQLEKYKKHYELLTQKGGIQMSDMSYDYLSAWCAKEMDTVFGKGDILYIQTVHYVHNICMTNRLWPAAAVYGGIALTAFRQYYGEHSREYAGLLVSLGEAYGKEGLLSKCGSCFKTAEKIYRVVPGECHPFYTDVFMPLYKKYVTIASAVMEFGRFV